MSAATTFWRPSPLVVELAIDPQGRGDYTYVSRRPGLKEPGNVGHYVTDTSHPLYATNGINRIHPQGGALLRSTWCTPDFVMGPKDVILTRFSSAKSSPGRIKAI